MAFNQWLFQNSMKLLSCKNLFYLVSLWSCLKAKKWLPHLIINSNVYATFSDECIFGDDNDQLTSTYGDYGTFNAMPRPQSAATYHDSNTGEAGGLISKQASTDMLIEQPPSNNKRTTKSGRASKKSKSREPLGRNQGGGSQPCLLMTQQHQVWSH